MVRELCSVIQQVTVGVMGRGEGEILMWKF